MRVIILGIFLFSLLSSCAVAQKSPDYSLVTVKRNYAVPKNTEEVQITISWAELLKHNSKLKSGFELWEGHFGKSLSYERVTHSDGKEYLVIDYTFPSNEPVFTFYFKPSKSKLPTAVAKSLDLRSDFEISFLKPLGNQKFGKEMPNRIVESTMKLYPDIKDFPVYAPHRWNYEYGFFMTGTYLLGTKTGKPAYTDFAQSWIDNFIQEDGFKPKVYKMKEYKLDDILPGRLAILLHQETKDPKYKVVVDTLMLHLSRQPKTEEGGYWHKEIYTEQMWLDGIYMADVFATQVAKNYHKPEYFSEAAHQIKLIYEKTLDPATGLMYHGWDASKNPVWAHPERGTSPEFWGRAIGWYLMALAEVLDYLPADHPERADLVKIFQDLSRSVLAYREKESGLWYQVLDQPGKEGNWIETSCSAMFAYAYAKGVRLGFLELSYLKVANDTYSRLLQNYVFEDKNGVLHFDQTVKIGTLNPKNSKGDYEYYITTERRINDYKGLASLLFLSMELNELKP
jgi:unsaturated rhamnogalacturonyl hydrolase